MKVDLYTKATLTVIAICLLILTSRAVLLIPEAKAVARATVCTGELSANAWGGIKASIGGYTVRISCN
jgi:hypothetical protein